MSPHFFILFYGVVMKKLIKSPLLIVPFVICLAIVVYTILNVVFSPYWDSVYAPTGYLSLTSLRTAESADTVYTNKQACEDVDYLLKYLKRVHPKYIDGLPDDIIQLSTTKKNSFGEEVSSYEIWRACAEILHLVGDSQTFAVASFKCDYLVDYIKKMAAGYKVVSVNGKSVADLLQENSYLYSYDNESMAEKCLLSSFQTLQGFKFLKIDTSEITIVYTDKAGFSEKQVYTADDFYDYDTAVALIGNDDDTQYSSSFDDKNNLAVITFKSCDFDSEYKKFLYDFFNEVFERNIRNIAIDLRDVSSGSSQTAEEFIFYLNQEKMKIPGGVMRLGPYIMKWKSNTQLINHYDDALFDGKVYVLTSNSTFGSGTMFAEMIQDNGFGKIIGEQCSDFPDTYGEVVVFQTPNSVLSFQVSSKHFYRIDESKSNLPIEPDYVCTADQAEKVLLSILNSNILY